MPEPELVPEPVLERGRGRVPVPERGRVPVPEPVQVRGRVLARVPALERHRRQRDFLLIVLP